MSNREGPGQGGATAETVESLLTAGAAVLMVASLVCLIMLISSAFGTPRVGDMVVFKPGTQLVDAQSVTVRHAKGPQATCVLDPDTMVQDGGSLVVETRSATGHAYSLHWAGGQTAAGARTCGRSAELVMSKSDLQTLVNAMGGRGLAGRGNVF